MIVTRQPDARHAVTDHAGNILAAPFETNAQAWRWIDRQSGDPVSAAEKRGQWVSDQILGREDWR